jgi:hypothetical protein
MSVPIGVTAALVDYIRPVAAKAGVTARIGWHSLRHSVAAELNDYGTNLKVIQEILRTPTAAHSGVPPPGQGPVQTRCVEDLQVGASHRSCCRQIELKILFRNTKCPRGFGGIV